MMKSYFVKSGGTKAKVWHRMLKLLLPKDKNFWKVYAPVIRILKDSQEHGAIREKINEHLGLNDRDIVLEEGCGKAVWLSEIQSLVARTVCLDNEVGMLKGARKTAPQAMLVRSNLNWGLPFRNETFTKIGSILVDGYLTNREIARGEKFRVLVPGGMIAVVTPKKGAKFFKVLKAEVRQRKEERTVIENLKRLPLAIIAIIFGKIAELKAVVGDWHFYEKGELVEAYRKAGFEIVACESVYADQAWLLIAKKPSQS
jgi:ubiquinone/menaquinone biosynthesis C-methylase UbiE